MGDERISVSRSTLRAELGELELRLVDRLNGALDSKADKTVQEQHSRELADLSSRILTLEGAAVKKDGAELTAVRALAEANRKRLDEVSSVGRYKRWLWAQTAVLAGIAIPAVLFLIDHWVSP